MKRLNSLIIVPQLGTLGRNAEPEIAERAEEDGRVADAQARVDNQRPARVGQDLPQHHVPRAFAPRLRGEHVFARLDVQGQAAHDAKDAGSRGERDRDEDVERAGADLEEAERIGVEDEGREQPCARDRGQRQPERKLAWLRAITGDEVYAEQCNRKGEEKRRQRIRDWRLENARRHQEVEQKDDREGQHQIGEEGQRSVDAAAEIAGRQAERDAD